METEKTEFPLQNITLDQSLQPRAALDGDTVEDYAARYTEGAEMPAITLFHDDGVYWLADGFHRVTAAGKARRETILADVREGTRHDALMFAAAANTGHGLRRTNADKRRAVEMLLGDAECAGWSDSEIARHCKVNHHLVAEMRSRHLGELQDNTVATPYLGELQDEGKSIPATRTVTRNGKTYQMRIGNIGRRSASGAGTGPKLRPFQDTWSPKSQIAVPRYRGSCGAPAWSMAFTAALVYSIIG